MMKGVPRTRHKTLRELGVIPDWLTPSQAAELLQVHPQTVRVWIREGRIPSQKFGGSRRIPRDELLASRARSNAAARAARTSPQKASLPTRADPAEARGLEDQATTVTNADAAKMLGISRATIERWVRAGRFSLVAVGANQGKRRIVRDERFELLLAQRNVT